MWCVPGRWEFVQKRPSVPELRFLFPSFITFPLFLLVPIWPTLALWHLLAWSFISRQWHILRSSEQVSRYPLLLLAFKNVSRAEPQGTLFDKNITVFRHQTGGLLIGNGCLHAASVPWPWEARWSGLNSPRVLRLEVPKRKKTGSSGLIPPAEEHDFHLLDFRYNMVASWGDYILKRKKKKK